MGEEWGAAQPFPYFCDFSGELAAAVRDGRRAEFAKFPEFRDPARQQRIPDPAARATFLSAKLDWQAAARGAHAEWLSFYRRLLSLRRAEIVPRLAGIRGNSGRYEIVGARLVRACWTLGDGSTLALAANLSAAPQAGSAVGEGRVILSLGVVADEQSGPWQFGPWSVLWSLADAG
jgi:maltooligosyltrehalose trehalohydrolase